MAKIYPDQALLENGLRSINFFNGRLLTGEDLTQEQAANRAARQLLGQSLGEGVVTGLFASAHALNNNTETGLTLSVKSGMAVNRLGQVLVLPADQSLSISGSAKDDPLVVKAVFKNCDINSETTFTGGAGLYLLTIAPAAGSAGRAPASGLGNAAAACNTRYLVEGVQFHLIRLKTPLVSDQLQNILAYSCLTDLDVMAEIFGSPFTTPPGAYGMLDTLRPDILPDCDVPLALVYRTNPGIQFVDNWSVRRKVTARTSSDPWEYFISDRKNSEREAGFLQFQEQVAHILRTEPGAAAAMAASKRFKYLPPAGLLPIGKGGFDWHTFLGSHAPATATAVDAGLLPDLLADALDREPFVVESKNPLIAVDVFYIPSGKTATEVYVAQAQDQILVQAQAAVLAQANYSKNISFAVSDAMYVENKAVETGMQINTNVPATPAPTAPAPTAPAPAPAPVVDEGGYILFARSRQGRIRVQFAGASFGAVSAQFTARTDETNLEVKSKAVAGNTYLVQSLSPGAYKVDGVVVGYGPQKFNLSVVGGQVAVKTISLKSKAFNLFLDVYKLSRVSGLRLGLVSGTFDEAAKQADTAPWSKLTKVTTLDSDAVARLAEWKAILAGMYTGFDIEKATPVLYMNRSFKPPQPPSGLYEVAQAYAVFGRFGVPLTAIAPLDLARSPIPLTDLSEISAQLQSAFVGKELPASPINLADSLLAKLQEYGISHLDHLAGAYLQLIVEATDLPSATARQYISQAITLIRYIHEKGGAQPVLELLK